jgi:ABC-type dipeptide/oligopeptide/nickel transport system permease component
VGRGRYIAKRLVFTLVTLFVVVTMNFFLFRAAPGDATARFAHIPGADALRAQVTQDFGLDRSAFAQYTSYLRELAQGNLGISYSTREPVSSNLWTAVRNSLPMVVLGTLFAIATGVLTGVISAWRRGTWADHGGVLAAMTFYALPSQWLGIVLIFLLGGLLPAGGREDPFLLDPTFWERSFDVLEHTILPALTLGLLLFGSFALIVRSAMLETLGEDFVLTARAKGLSPWATVWKHAFRNAMLPTITLIAGSVAWGVGVYVLVETVFSYPGAGRALYQAVIERDYPMLQGAFLMLTVVVLACNLIADLLYTRLDPRVRL